MITTKKTCFKCGRTLEISEFYKHSAMSDGHLGKCKECTKKDVSKHRIDNIERIRSYDRKRSSMPHRMKNNYQMSVAYKKEFPNRVKATNAVNNAIRKNLIKKLPCFVCGAEKVVGHHPDYKAPLDVVWLCQAHHKQTHAMVNKEERKAA